MRYSTTALLAAQVTFASAYQLAREYSGKNFFNGWDFFDGYDYSQSGDAMYLGQAAATSANLAYVDSSSGSVIVKVDNTTNVPWNDKRNSVEISTQDFYGIGSVFVADFAHLPYGCSVWPAFWTRGKVWPDQGEIDIIETVNLMGHNQMALHTTSGCTHTTPSSQVGSSGETNCNATSGSGCTVAEQKANSFGSDFASAGGGVFATQFDVSGIYIWFWSRADVPSTISASNTTIDPSTWGAPSAAYPTSSCEVSKYFGAQQLVLDINLCGPWANSTYSQTCGTGECYLNSVINAGSPNYDNAYFDISYIRVFSADNASVVTPSGTTTGDHTATSTGSAGTASATTSSGAMALLKSPSTLLWSSAVTLLLTYLAGN
ncbi:glycoside hydrolase family 16 protein [Neolentinus lepideus HHB14362 ss-1]|uniref:Glycoside hydrolase family 16 protein n=1 Tax=Neolentinus lepideus HHB14362 ss-1 TaxID=1314782 RepID=A0A165UNN3_9AGAM|nr:glycoside hydrolase family 16 protein [Neolentinus lepideus HHB14362 ss-1]